MTVRKPLAVVAVGGNALIRDDRHLSIPDQYEAVTESATHIADMIAAGWNVVLTHGNGPQVGFILRRSELASQEVAPVPLDYAVGDTQGAIGYMFQKALTNELHRRGIERRVVALVTQTRVSADDPAFEKPAKPVGAFFDEATAKKRQEELGWTLMEDAGRGWRRTVPSPEPLEIIERDVIASLLAQGCVVIACGGGGIPVVRKNGKLSGVEAVIDKDLASALLAQQLKADLLLIPTGVEQVAVNFGTPEQRWLDTMSVSEARELIAQGQFGAGSMLPKVEAILRFVSHIEPDGHAGEGLITSPAAIRPALERRTGTWITP
ncbi:MULTISPECIES: carbamate kinase [Caballeronia]|jgi:carbamate kinase|uniref:Carbamate kinase n=1 Tax=Caballeronia zhejiangensis TaxID=871203 RepID=A0A656QCH1_9BURK|nr:MULTISPECIES: carbamate kinase [Caballeronia]KDR27705.1 carbamate kinase [Caballeronia zhejiangensis]MCG7405374.1 carbamate kinase [Caballeronia zhejiangensis]MCI1047240.1 carbamate kinase [Caballeronia zhejiangensis]MDR5769242.1 carbamate kinase [Caballeronia sp. LZ028]MDR5789532.1 carbamate kinase [Caballeronia sp. LP003]